MTGVTHDSRAVRPGDLYVAVQGQRVHGAKFAAQAARAGAAAVLTDPAGYDRAAATRLPVITVPDPRSRLGDVAAWIYGHPARELLLIGTTGTSGKTTVSYLVESGLREAGMRTGLVGTVEIRVDDERIDSSLTTPEATELHGLFALMRERDVAGAAMEVSSHALALGRVAGVRYDVAVFTNLSQDHLDFHADLHDYFETKARLFTPEVAKVAVVNRDDSFGRTLIDRITEQGAIPVTTFSATGDTAADWYATDVVLEAGGSRFRVVGPGGMAMDASVRLPGPFNVANAMAAIVALIEAGVPPTAAAGAAAPAAPGRMERVDERTDFTAIVDYSHKPGRLGVLTSLRPITEGRLTIVVGCGGDATGGNARSWARQRPAWPTRSSSRDNAQRTRSPLYQHAKACECLSRSAPHHRGTGPADRDRTGRPVPSRNVVVVAAKGMNAASTWGRILP